MGSLYGDNDVSARLSYLGEENSVCNLESLLLLWLYWLVDVVFSELTERTRERTVVAVCRGWS